MIKDITLYYCDCCGRQMKENNLDIAFNGKVYKEICPNCQKRIEAVLNWKETKKKRVKMED